MAAAVLSGFSPPSGLQRGETDALALCRVLAVEVLLTDDLAARDEARRLSLTPVGSLGVVVRAFRRGGLPLDAAEEALRALQDVSSLWVTASIVELAIEQIRRPR